MKTLTCKQLGGACNLQFQSDDWDDMAAQSKQHGMEMMQKGDKAHLEAMEKMKQMMNDPTAMQ